MMLESLSGREHEVLSGLCLLSSDARRADRVVETRVRFAKLSRHEIGWYLRSGEYADKAGAYGIQGLASLFVESIEGCYFNVVGLPVRALYEMLGQLAVSPGRLAGPRGGSGR